MPPASLDLAPFHDFAARVTVPTKELGRIKMGHFLGTQTYLGQEVARGVADGVRAFVILKGGRQVGGSTWLDLFTLYWLQAHSGMIGQFVSDDQGNMRYRRSLLRKMLASLPRDYRLPTNADNADALEWASMDGEQIGSTLLFDYAGVREGSNLGRSKGMNYLYADEVGSWTDHKAVEALKSALAETFPDRFYFWISTARGFNVFRDMWIEAQDAVTTRAIFLPWWRNEPYRVEEGEARWERYAGRLRSDERMMVREVKRRYGVELEPEQMVWWRWKKDEEFLGDEAMMSQEFGSLPEECFQAFGDKFIPPTIIRKLQYEVDHAPKATGYTYEPGQHFDKTRAALCSPSKAALLVWDEPDPEGAYIIAGHAWGSSSPAARHWVAQVWRVWPDQMTQVAEYTAETGTTYGFAWLLIYLGGAYYGRGLRPWLINETQGPGQQVTREVRLFEETGFGLSPAARKAGMQDVLGCAQHYFWARPDQYASKSLPIDIQIHGTYRPYVLHALADTVIRGKMTIRSARLIHSLSALRRGETGDADEIAGGAGASDAHAMCAAAAVRCWQDDAMYQLSTVVMPKEQEKNAPTTVLNWMTRGYIQNVMTRGRG